MDEHTLLLHSILLIAYLLADHGCLYKENEWKNREKNLFKLIITASLKNKPKPQQLSPSRVIRHEWNTCMISMYICSYTYLNALVNTLSVNSLWRVKKNNKNKKEQNKFSFFNTTDTTWHFCFNIRFSSISLSHIRTLIFSCKFHFYL